MKLVRCYIRKDTEGFSKRSYPSYELHLTRDNRFIMLGRKMKIKPPITYLITMNQQRINKEEPEYLGKLKSNTTATEFNAYGKGKAPDSASSMQEIRNQYASIVYSRRSYNETKVMTVHIPKITEGNKALIWKVHVGVKVGRGSEGGFGSVEEQEAEVERR